MFNRKSSAALVCRGALSFLFGCLSILPALSAAETKPKIHLVAPEFDFGSVVEGVKVKHVFSVQNVGDAPLQIQRLVPSCGCTASTASADHVDAGKGAEVTVEFDTSGFAGDKVKAVRLYTNDTERPVTMLTLRGSIEPLITVTPDRIALGEVAQGSQIERQIEVRVQEGSGLHVGKLQSFSSALSLSGEEGAKGLKKATVRFAADVPLGEFRDRIVVSIDGKSPRSVNIPVFAVVTGDLKLTPPAVSFGLLEGSTELVRTVRLQSRGSSPLVLPELRSSNPAIRASVKPVHEGREFEIEVLVNPKELQKDLKAVLEIVAPGAKERRVSLSVFGVLPPKV